MFGVYFRVFASVTKAFGSVCRSLKRNILIFFSLIKFKKCAINGNLAKKTKTDKIQSLGHFWPTTCNSDSCGLIPSSSFFARRNSCDGYGYPKTWKLYVLEKVLNQQTDYRNKNLKYRSTNMWTCFITCHYHVTIYICWCLTCWC